MGKKATYNKVEKELQIIRQYNNSAELFGKEYSLPATEEEFIQALEKNNMVGEFCYIIYQLQNTHLSCLDDYKFYLEYRRDSSDKNCAADFSKSDVSKMFGMCKEYRRRSIYVIGILLYRGYEPQSVYEFFAEHYIADNRPEALAALDRADEVKAEEEAQILRDKELIRREKELKNNPPFSKEVIIRRIKYSPFSEWGLKFTVDILQKKDIEHNSCLRQEFFRILYTLQYKNRNLNIFDKDKFNEFIKTYWCKFMSLEDFDSHFYGFNASIILSQYKGELEYLLLNQTFYTNQYGENEFNNKVKLYENYIEELKHYNYYDEEFSEIIPDEYECDELWKLYTKREDTLVFSIAILLHEKVKAEDWKRVLNYYLTSGEHVKIAENPVRYKVDPNPYVVHPELKPLDKSVIKRAINRPKYKVKSARDVILFWDNTNKGNVNRYAFLLCIFTLQMKGGKFIDEEIFKKVFSEQIEEYNIKKSWETLTFDVDTDIDSIMPDRIEENEEFLREFAILIDIGYRINDIYQYYKKIV